MPSTTLSVYVPITSPAGFFAGTESTALSFSSNNLNEVVSIATVFSVPLISVLPGVNVTSFDCSTPWISVEVAGSAVGATPTICGV